MRDESGGNRRLLLGVTQFDGLMLDIAHQRRGLTFWRTALGGRLLTVLCVKIGDWLGKPRRARAFIATYSVMLSRVIVASAWRARVSTGIRTLVLR